MYAGPIRPSFDDFRERTVTQHPSTPVLGDADDPKDEVNNLYLLREKCAHIVKAARSATAANVLAPLLCIPMFEDEVRPSHLYAWLGYMFIVVLVRSWVVFSLEHKPEKILDPQRDLKLMTFSVAIVGFGWGLGWILMTPDLLMVNRMIYVYMTTAAMIASMFAYSVNSATFNAFTLPIMVPALSTVLWPVNVFPWPFTLGLASLYLVVLGIAKSFSQTFENSVRLRFRNENLYQELARERDQSIASNVEKSKFIAVASHDLRQPMHAVNVYLDLLNPDNLPLPASKTLQKIKNSIATLNAMFESLLNISKLDSYAMQVNKQEIRLLTLADEIHDYLESKAHGKGLALRISCPDLCILGDKLLLQQIINNLVSNAIQYTDHGDVRVTFEARQDLLAIEIRDTGCGIAESDQEQIFNDFYRADQTRAFHDGLGLGLSIVKRLCGLIGAKIEVNSALGRGSTFTVSTSYALFDRAEQVQVDVSTTTVSDQGLQGKSIAVIEDDPVIVDAYRHTFASKGAHVHVLSEHEKELDFQLQTIDHIDCILSDYRLSHTTGDLLIQRLRETYNEDIPAVIVTADTSPAHIALLEQLNVPVLHKPVSFGEVVQAIEKLLIKRISPRI